MNTCPVQQRLVDWFANSNRLVHTTAAEATPKLINPKTIKALVQCTASKDVSDFTDKEWDCRRYIVQHAC